MHALIGLSLATLALFAQPTFALDASSPVPLEHLQTRWAEISYQVPEPQREAAFALLAAEAETAVAAAPGKAEPLIWQGIILSSWAGAKGGLGALGLVKDARASLEQALQIAPEALDGAAYTSLAALYAQVPGWPISFGDKGKAESLFLKALAIDPVGIDPNYFYGDMLVQQKRYDEARLVLRRALEAPDRTGRPLADAGRREQVQRLLAQIPPRN